MWVVRPKKIITAVREPVGRNLSAFMYNSRRENWGKSLSEFLEHYPHDRPLTWFDDEMKYFTGIDVFDYPFPHDRGWQVVEDRILIIKAESDDDTKEEALGHFLGEKIVLPRSNVGSQSYYAADYANLKSQPIPEHYLDYMYNSRYARHFYSDEEIARFRTHWTQG